MSFDRRSCKFLADAAGSSPRGDYQIYRSDSKTRVIVYATEDLSATALADGYFDQLAGEIDIGTVIFVVLVDDIDPDLRSSGLVIPVMVTDK